MALAGTPDNLRNSSTIMGNLLICKTCGDNKHAEWLFDEHTMDILPKKFSAGHFEDKYGYGGLPQDIMFYDMTCTMCKKKYPSATGGQKQCPMCRGGWEACSDPGSIDENQGPLNEVTKHLAPNSQI